MPQGIIQRILALFGGQQDPSQDFGEAQKISLSWDFDKKKLNGISFGDPIDGATQFGLANTSKETVSAKSICLTFARSGLFLEFELPNRDNPNYCFDYFGILVGPDPTSEKEGTIDYTSVTLLPGQQVWDHTTTRESLDEIFGPPYRTDNEEYEDVRYYEFDDIEYEFEFNPGEGSLKRINVYPFI